MSTTNVVGATLIAGGAALVGAMSGWELGPYRLEFTRDQFALVGAAICGVVALAACSLAMERSEARARSQSAMRRLSAILFRSQTPADSGRFPQPSNSHHQAPYAGSAGGGDDLAGCTANGA